MEAKKLILALMLIGTCLFNQGCKKPEKGDKGDVGPAGADGNANVTCEVITTSTWSYSAPSYYTDIFVSSLTTAIADEGATMVYAQTGASTYSQLPITFYPTATYSRTLEVVTAPYTVRIIVTDSDLTAPAPPGTMTFKIITIPSRIMSQNSELNFKDYNAVKKAFDLKD